MRPPIDASANLDAVGVDAIRPVPVFDGGPSIEQPGQEASPKDPEGQTPQPATRRQQHDEADREANRRYGGRDDADLTLQGDVAWIERELEFLHR